MVHRDAEPAGVVAMTTPRAPVIGVIWLYSALLTAVALVIELAVVVPTVDHDRAWSWPVVVALAVAFFAAESVIVHLHLGREAYAFSVMEIPLVLGLFFVRPDLLVVARVAGGLAAFVVQRRSPDKTAFNCAMFAIETVCAVGVWHLVLGEHDPLGPLGWVAVAAAALVTSVLSSVLVGLAMLRVSGRWPMSLLRLFAVGLVGDLVNACFAIVTVYILTVEWRAAWLLLVVAGVLVLAYRSYEGARQRSESLEQVNRFTELVGREVRLEAVVDTVLEQVRDAFGARTVQLRLTDATGGHRDWVFDDAGSRRGFAGLVERLTPYADDVPLLVPRRSRSGPATVLEREGVQDGMLVPLHSEGRSMGHLVAAGKNHDLETFGEADLRQLRAFANHAAVALDNADRAHQIVAAAQESARQAMLDELTGLSNRRMLRSRLAEALLEGPVTVLLLGLDRFKDVNDTLGQEIGDRLLCLVARRLEHAVTAGALVARTGGDEFAVLLTTGDELEALACASLAQGAVARTFDLDGIAVAMEASLGVAVGGQGTDAVAVLRWADVALHAAKTNRTGVETYRPELDRRDAKRLGLLADLREAVAANTLTVHYQPKIDLVTGAVIGVEALARWFHPQHGFIGPDEFIPLAEHSALITPLTTVVLRTALRDCEQWLEAGRAFSVAVNISPRSLLDPGFVDEVTRALAQSAVPATSLTLEITETSLMSDPTRAIEALARLREVGVRLSVDDLGTGYSSLSYLQRLPVHEIKIDRSFVMALPDPSSAAVVGAVIDLGHRLGHHVVAEGIEDAAAFETLRELGCDSAQGFWMSRPLSAEALTDFLGSYRTAPARSLHSIR